MDERKKIVRPHSNTVYEIDGVSCGMDESLVEVIKDAIRRRVQSNSLEIPKLPHVANRILQISRNPNFDTNEIVKAIISDPFLAGRVLTIANSAAYGAAKRTENLKQALMRLGVKMVRDVVFAESVRVKIFSVRSYREILEQSWRLSLGSAIACEAISKVTRLETDGAFLLGLLHDTGKPVLVNAIYEYERKNSDRALGMETVEILLSQLHEEIGGYVLDRWGMPPTMVDAAAGHHRYRGSANATPAHRLVVAANLICKHLGIGEEPRDVDFTIEHVFKDLKIDNFDTITKILDTVTREMEGMMSGLDGGAIPPPAEEPKPKPASPYRRAS